MDSHENQQKEFANEQTVDLPPEDLMMMMMVVVVVVVVVNCEHFVPLLAQPRKRKSIVRFRLGSQAISLTWQ